MPEPTTPTATTPTPAPEDTNSSPASATPTTQGDPADKPLGENGEKALKAERARADAEAKKNVALQKQLDDINTANMSDLEKAKKAAKDAEESATSARTEALRFRIAASKGISDEDAELFLTGADEATMQRQADRLLERLPASPRPDPSQGAGGGTPPSAGPEQDFANFLSRQLR